MIFVKMCGNKLKDLIHTYKNEDVGSNCGNIYVLITSM